LNEQSLQAANAFLRVASESTPTGEVLKQPPAEIGKEAGLPNPLAVARAVRALAARRRLEVEDGQYRLLDPKPLDPGEPESVPRAPRRRKARRRGATRTGEPGGGERRATYADLGRTVLDRVIELGRETAEAVASAEHLRREVKENKAARIEAEQRASRLFERVKELETKLEMAEQNLRTVLTAARGRGATAAPADSEMEAVLRILKAPAGTAAPGPDEDGPEEATGE
jgi:signal transduction histidine kinase